MLETIRELAVEQAIAHGEGIGLRRRHAVHYLEVALSANLSADGEGAQRFDLVIPERDNLRAALRWAAEEGAIERGLELFVALENYWATSLPDEGVEWAATLLPAADAGDVSPSLIARALRVQGGMQNIVGQLDAADASWERALGRGPHARRRSRCRGAPAPPLALEPDTRRHRARPTTLRGEPRRTSSAPAVPQGRGAGADISGVGGAPGGQC